MGPSKVYDLTQGEIGKPLLLFALPLLGSSFIQQLYNTVDLWCTGFFISKEAMAAVGASSMVIVCLVGFFTGVSVGMSVLIANAYGAGDQDKIRRGVNSSVTIGILVGLILMGIGIAGAPLFLGWMHTPESILADAVLYVRIYFLSMIPLVIYNICSGNIRALGNSRAPLLMQLTGGIINVVLDIVLLQIMENGIAGVALATLFSQGVAAWLAVRWLKKGNGGKSAALKKLILDKKILAEVIRLGVPAGLQTLVIALSNVVIQYVINGFGVDAMAAFAAYLKVELPIYLPLVAFGQAIMTFSGQNAGAQKTERLKKGVYICMGMGIVYAAAASFLLIWFGEQAFGLFSRDPQVIAYGNMLIRITFPFYFIYAILEVLADAIRGAGRSLAPMVIILLNICILRSVVLIILVHMVGELRVVGISYPVAWLTCAVCLAVYWKSGRWERSKKA